jgi:hypothetical protein
VQLRRIGHDAVHVREYAMASAADESILARGALAVFRPSHLRIRDLPLSMQHRP